MTFALGTLRSVRGRITLVSTALVAVTLVLASLFLLRLVRDDLLASAEEAVDQALEAQAEQFGLDSEFLDAENAFEVVWAEVDGSEVGVGVFELDPEDPEGVAFGELYVDDEVAAMLTLDPDTGDVIEVFDPLFEVPLEDPELRERVESLVFEVFELSDTNGTRFLVGATPLDEIEASVDAVERALLVIVPILILMLGLSTWLLVGRALHPVMSITKQVEDISSSNMHQRVSVPKTGDEVADLATVMNHMLDRLERGGERQRQFSADASHELRSPLATVRAAAEMLGRKPDQKRADRLTEDILAESDRMDHLIGDLLELSRLDEDRRSVVMESVELVRLLNGELRDDVATGTVSVEAPAELRLDGSPSQLRRLIRNLVDNATRHAVSQVKVLLVELNGSVEVNHGGEGRLLLVVEDDGAGVPVADRDLVFERFARLDQARDRGSGGSGLGLALVRAIVVFHGGSITIDDSPLGGARFTVSL